MKTMILVSGFAVISLLIPFKEAPHHTDVVKSSNVTAGSNPVQEMNRPHVLPGVVITPGINKETLNNSVLTDESRGNLKSAKAGDADASPLDTDNSWTLPEVTETDYGYLKFNIDDYDNESVLNGNETIEMPENEMNPVSITSVSEFEYLKFDVNEYMSAYGNVDDAISDLPSATTETAADSKANEVEILSAFGYLKFSVTKYYSPVNEPGVDAFELPEE